LRSIPNGKKLKACIPGGSSVPIVPANLLLKTATGEPRYMNYESLADGGFATGTMMGSGGFIVLDEDQCVVKHTMTLARFLQPRKLRTMYTLPKEQDGCIKF
jgi:NADH-quinone oxidoreductase subunit F